MYIRKKIHTYMHKHIYIYIITYMHIAHTYPYWQIYTVLLYKDKASVNGAKLSKSIHNNLGLNNVK